MEKRLKKVWLVRHGQSLAQTEEEYGIDTSLSKKGEKQAKRLKNVLSHVKFDKIFLSPLKRARETFEFSGLERENVEFDTRLVEELPDGAYSYILPYPSTPAYGKQDVHNAWMTNVRSRAKSFYDELCKSEGRHFLVMSHAGFLNHLLTIFLSLHEFELFERFKYCQINNTGVSVLYLGSQEKYDALLVWNDLRHAYDLVDYDPLIPFEDGSDDVQEQFKKARKFFRKIKPKK